MRSFVLPGPLAGLLVLTAASAFASWACFFQLGGYDLSPLVDLFWRMKANEIPGQDFIYTFPPVLLLAAKLFGFSNIGWHELTLANIILSALCYLTIAFLAPREKRTTLWLTAVAMVIATPMCYTNHIWHSSASQLCAMLFFFSIYVIFDSKNASIFHYTALFFTSALLTLSKQNVALPTLLLITPLAFALSKNGRIAIPLTIACGFAMGVILTVLPTGMSIENFISIYTSASGRPLFSKEMYDSFFETKVSIIPLVFYASCVIISFYYRYKLNQSSEKIILAICFMGLAVLPIITDWDAKINDTPLPLFIGATLVIYESNHTSERGRQLVMTTLIGMTLLVAIVGGLTRERMRNVGFGAFYEPDASHVVADGYFRGMVVGDRLANTLNDMALVKERYPQARLFFGPRIEFGYAVTHTRSPHGLPLWWHPGSSYSTKDEAGVVEAFIGNRFDILIFLNRDRTRMPAALLRYIEDNYDAIQYSGAIDLYKRKQYLAQTSRRTDGRVGPMAP